MFIKTQQITLILTPASEDDTGVSLQSCFLHLKLDFEPFGSICPLKSHLEDVSLTSGGCRVLGIASSTD